MKYASVLLLGVIAILGLAFSESIWPQKYSELALVSEPYFLYNFNSAGTLNESGNMAESSSPYWWLNSGGILNIEKNIGNTNIGELPKFSKWRLLYRISNPKDTDQGYHPQNIFRLVSRNTWKDFQMETYFKIIKDNLSSSTNRNVSNGLLLMSRYQDANNLYYVGIRVDGTAIIKKKWQGEYFTLAQEKIFSGIYNRQSNPSLLPKDKWIGISTIIKNNIDGSVSIELLLDTDDNKQWETIMKTVDYKGGSDHDPIINSGSNGIRTDFMDVQFRDFKVLEI